jgi:hypothetical protein
MRMDDSAPESSGGGGQNPEVTVQLADEVFEVRLPAADGTFHTAVFPYPAAYPCADKGGASRATARTEAGVIEIRVRCKNGEDELYTFRYEVPGGSGST